ncbi:MAG: alkaline phosphatase PhoX, partial [Flavobacteriaceae bacterium]
MNIKILPFLLFNIVVSSQQIGDFISVPPGAQNTDFIIPSSHRFQKIIEAGDALSQGGNLMANNDFSGYVPIGGSSTNGYLAINAETAPGGVSILDVNYNSSSNLWQVTNSQAVDFSSLVLTAANCSGTVTPWNTIISCEEYTSIELENNPNYGFPRDLNGDGYDDLGWAIEIDPATKTVIDQPGGRNGPDKLWAMGNFKHENAAIHNNQRTVYQGADATLGYLYKFVSNSPQDLSSGNLYVYTGPKNGSGNWVQLNNTTQAEINSTTAQSTAVGATAFNGIEDVEIGPDGKIYFAVKEEGRVYRFQDSDPISGTTVSQMETYVGNATYTVTHEGGSSNVNWGTGNDNMAFDGDGNLWVLQDAGNFQNYIWVIENGHTQSNPKVKIFARTPADSEPTGITFSPDYQFLFMSIQHPNSNNGSTTQTDAAGNQVAFNKSVTLVISQNSPTDQTWYLDADGDGYAAPNTISSPTSPGIGYTTNILPLTDCNDNNASINPNTIWYLDADGDGYADPTTVESCQSPGTGYSTSVIPTTDCDDNDA